MYRAVRGSMIRLYSCSAALSLICHTFRTRPRRVPHPRQHHTTGTAAHARRGRSLSSSSSSSASLAQTWRPRLDIAFEHVSLNERTRHANYLSLCCLSTCIRLFVFVNCEADGANCCLINCNVILEPLPSIYTFHLRERQLSISLSNYIQSTTHNNPYISLLPLVSVYVLCV